MKARAYFRGISSHPEMLGNICYRDAGNNHKEQ